MRGEGLGRSRYGGAEKSRNLAGALGSRRTAPFGRPAAQVVPRRAGFETCVGRSQELCEQFDPSRTHRALLRAKNQRVGVVFAGHGLKGATRHSPAAREEQRRKR